MSLIKNIFKEAKEFPLCDRFTGKESFDEIAELLLSPQGIEFCTKNNFPDLDTFEQFDPAFAESKGVYINSGKIELENKHMVLLVGDTEAVLKYNNLDHPYNVVLMHNSFAEIHADNYAAVFVFGDKDNVDIHVKNNAIVE